MLGILETRNAETVFFSMLFLETFFFLVSSLLLLVDLI